MSPKCTTSLSTRGWLVETVIVTITRTHSSIVWQTQTLITPGPQERRVSGFTGQREKIQTGLLLGQGHAELIGGQDGLVHVALARN